MPIADLIENQIGNRKLAIGNIFMSFIGKTKTFFGLNALKNLVSDSMAIDMGSASTIIAVRGRGVVVDEPSLVAVNKVTGEVIAVGNEAHKMQGREARETTDLHEPERTCGFMSAGEDSERVTDRAVDRDF